MHFTDDLVGFWIQYEEYLDAVEEYNAEPAYLQSNSKFLPAGAEDKQVFLALSSLLKTSNICAGPKCTWQHKSIRFTGYVKSR